MAELLLVKPSRIHNLSYISLGYYLSLYFSYDLNLPIDQKIILTTFLGGFIGTLVYYIKPVERVISLYFRLSKKNVTYPDEPFDEFKSPVYKSEILFSNYLQDERTIINGAIFLAIGTFTFNKILESIIGLSQIYMWFLIIVGIALICIGIWEIYILISRKMPILVFFYNYQGISKNLPQLERAIQSKDWIQADKIMDKEPELLDSNLLLSGYAYYQQSPKMGVCIRCQKIRDSKFCIECGYELRKRCSRCEASLVGTDDKIFPKYCRKCGLEIK